MLSLAEERRGRGARAARPARAGRARLPGRRRCSRRSSCARSRALPNRVAVLVDASRSMEVRPARRRTVARRARGGAARARGAAPGRLAAGRPRGRPVHASARASRPRPPALAARAARAPTRPASARRWATCARATPGAIWARWSSISDGIDTGRIGEGPLDAATRGAIEALGAPVHTVGLGEKSLRDLSVAAVLADEFAFVRTPASIEAVIRQTGLPDRQVEVTLERDGRPIATRSVVLRGDRLGREDLVRLAARSPRQLRVSHLDAGAGGRGAARATTSSRSR